MFHVPHCWPYFDNINWSQNGDVPSHRHFNCFNEENYNVLRNYSMMNHQFCGSKFWDNPICEPAKSTVSDGKVIGSLTTLLLLRAWMSNQSTTMEQYFLELPSSLLIFPSIRQPEGPEGGHGPTSGWQGGSLSRTATISLRCNSLDMFRYQSSNNDIIYNYYMLYYHHLLDIYIFIYLFIYNLSIYLYLLIYLSIYLFIVYIW